MSATAYPWPGGRTSTGTPRPRGGPAGRGRPRCRGRRTPRPPTRGDGARPRSRRVRREARGAAMGPTTSPGPRSAPRGLPASISAGSACRMARCRPTGAGGADSRSSRAGTSWIEATSISVRSGVTRRAGHGTRAIGPSGTTSRCAGDSPSDRRSSSSRAGGSSDSASAAHVPAAAGLRTGRPSSSGSAESPDPRKVSSAAAAGSSTSTAWMTGEPPGRIHTQ